MHDEIATYLAQIEELSRANRQQRDADLERRLLDLRHEAGIRLLQQPAGEPRYPEPDYDQLGDGQLPEATPDQLTPELLRAAILKSGCLVVRGLIDPGDADSFAGEIERSFAVREAMEAGEPGDEEYFRHFNANPGYDLASREWVSDAGGVWAADSPKLLFEMLDVFERRGLSRLVRDYLGEPPAFSVEKCTLRKVSPNTGNGFPGWHQDGRFLGDVRSLNVWLTLTHCGDTAPGLDVVPRRIDHVVPTGTEGAIFDWVVAPDVVDQVREGVDIMRPIFEPGDVMLFDDLFLHSTAADPAMPNYRYAVESWFFGPSAYPGKYTPLAL